MLVKPLYNPEKYKMVLRFANQIYDGKVFENTNVSLFSFCTSVVSDVVLSMGTMPVQRPDFIVACSFLCRAVSDGCCEYSDISAKFNDEVCKAVEALSGDINIADEDERFVDSLIKLRLLPGEVGLIKLAEWINILSIKEKIVDEVSLQQLADKAFSVSKELGSKAPFLDHYLNVKISRIKSLGEK